MTSSPSPRGLYIHIPFCHSRCYYCDFYSRASAEAVTMRRYVDRVIEEITARQGADSRFTTIYIGGGTPSILPLRQLERLIDSLNTSHCQEMTIEVNPEDVTDEFARFLKQSPINRVSMGVQSLVDTELKAVGRRHTSRQAVDAVDTLRNAGIENISLDLIYGLPGQTLDSWTTSLNGIIALRPEHLSTYLLSYERGTRLYAQRQKGTVVETDADTCRLFYDTMCRLTAAAGYEHYEISNLALPGFHARHNSSYWDFTPYLGIGPGAHSFDGTNRSYNRSDLKKYLDEGYTITLSPDVEDDTNRLNDMLITALRTARGLDLQQCAAKFGDAVVKQLLDDASGRVATGHIVIDNGRMTIPKHHWLITDAILVDIIQ